ncbi:MAG TPA: hypothetical protein DG577_04150 [Firmicutes bacterium]|nr:hypothetical protein [Bacillota bacterium]HBS93204.1 hypothetical protein [Bacillota bacterium]HCX78585.1 hypothetical protein [Bacillota bacterium]
MKKIGCFFLACVMVLVLCSATMHTLAATYSKTDSKYIESIYNFTANETGFFDYETGFSVSGVTNWVVRDKAPSGQYYTLQVINPGILTTKIYFSYYLAIYWEDTSTLYRAATPGFYLDSNGPY